MRATPRRAAGTARVLPDSPVEASFVEGVEIGSGIAPRCLDVTHPEVELYARASSVSDFFDRLERFVGSLEGRLRVGLRTAGERAARLVVEPDALTSHRKYQAFKDEAIGVAAALLTEVSIEQDGRGITFRLADWQGDIVPLAFDAKMVQRSWLSKLAVCFELARHSSDPSTPNRRLGPDRDQAYYEAIRHFEQATVAVTETNEQSVAATRAFFATATKQLAAQHAAMISGFQAEQEQRLQIFEQKLAESERLDVRQHAVVRREILSQLNALAEADGRPTTDPQVRRLRRRLGVAVCLVWIAGAALFMLGLFSPTWQNGNFWAGVLPALAPDNGSGEAGVLAEWGQVFLLVTGSAFWLGATWFGLGLLRRCLSDTEREGRRARRFRSDLLRMSWIAELWLETAETPKGERPADSDALLWDRFSRSLFIDDEPGDADRRCSTAHPTPPPAATSVASSQTSEPPPNRGTQESSNPNREPAKRGNGNSLPRRRKRSRLPR